MRSPGRPGPGAASRRQASCTISAFPAGATGGSGTCAQHLPAEVSRPARRAGSPPTAGTTLARTARPAGPGDPIPAPGGAEHRPTSPYPGTARMRPRQPIAAVPRPGPERAVRGPACQCWRPTAAASTTPARARRLTAIPPACPPRRRDEATGLANGAPGAELSAATAHGTTRSRRRLSASTFRNGVNRPPAGPAGLRAASGNRGVSETCGRGFTGARASPGG